MRSITTRSYGIRLPILKESDDVVEETLRGLLQAIEEHNLKLNDHDIIGVTEALVARTEGNYASTEDIAKDIHKKFNGSNTIGVLFPIQSRNRFSHLLKGIADGAEKVVVQLSFPSDEVGNQIISEHDLINSGVNPYSDVFNVEQFREKFGDKTKHMFTGIDYIDYYQSIAPNIDIIFSNNPLAILEYTKDVIVSSIHTRELDKQVLLENGGNHIITLAEILNEPSDKHGYNEVYGILGSNKSSDEGVKLFPRSSEAVVHKLQQRLKEETGKNIEVLVYGDGAFKDPVGHIWELADPVSAVAYTDGLKGTPQEIKIKYIADNQYNHLQGTALTEALKKEVKNKEVNTIDNDISEGTTPRQISDLVASLCDLTSGSGDKGTPVVLIQGYFDNYSDN